MTRAGLVRRKNGKYILTTFGKIVYESKITIEIALTNYWKLKAIDSLETSNELPKEEQQKLMETLLDNQDLRGILGKVHPSSSSGKEPDREYMHSGMIPNTIRLDE
jgi:predicted transcriptional regulator